VPAFDAWENPELECRGQPRDVARFALAVFFAATVLFAGGCGGSGQYVWYHDLPKTEWGGTSGEYVIGIGDTIRIQVYEQEALTTQAKIRPDGRIALPFVGEIMAAGKHPMGLAQELEARLKEFIVSPRVIVNVEDARPITVIALGEIGHVGSITLDNSLGLLEALAQAGGISQFGDKSAIYVIRKTPEFRRIRFTYDALLQNQDGAGTFQLRTGDMIVVE
jgi:polysaccharide export outer membrane protein